MQKADSILGRPRQKARALPSTSLKAVLFEPSVD